MEYATELNDEDYKRVQQYATLQDLSVDEAASRLIALAAGYRQPQAKYLNNVIPFRRDLPRV